MIPTLNAPYLKSLMLAGAVILTVGSVAGEARAQSRLAIPGPFDAFPNFVSAGVGTAPDYLGSDDYLIGAAPAARIDLDIATFRLLGNWAMFDLLTDSAFSIGPSGILRFGRNGVEDEVVSQLPELDITVELGLSAGYEFVDSEDPIKRLAIGADILHDVGGVHDGFVGNFYARATYPLWWQGSAIVGTLGATVVDDDFADTYFTVSGAESAITGLPAFNAGAGARDVRFGFGLAQSLSLNWHLGAGLIYSRVIGDAGRSPIVDERGSRNQFILGVGVAYAWGF